MPGKWRWGWKPFVPHVQGKDTITLIHEYFPMHEVPPFDYRTVGRMHMAFLNHVQREKYK